MEQTMNMTVKKDRLSEQTTVPAGVPVMAFDEVCSRAASDLWELQSGVMASRALSCLIEPEVGDRVLIASDGALGVIVSIISRRQGDTLSLNAANGGDIVLSADALALRGRREVALQAEAAISLSAPLGAVETVAHSLTQSVQGSLVTVADSIIEQARNVHLSADETIMTHAQIHSVTADQDLFMDADRINMG